MKMKKYIFFIIPMMASFCISLNAMDDDFGTIGNEESEVELPSDPLVFTGSAIMSDADWKNLLKQSEPPQLPPMNSNNGQPVASAVPQSVAATQVAGATSSAMASDIGSKVQASSSSNNGSASVLGIPSMAGKASASASSEKGKEDFYCHACKRSFVHAGAYAARAYANHRKSSKCLATADAKANEKAAADAAKIAKTYCSICEYDFGQPYYLQKHLEKSSTELLHKQKIKDREKKLANGSDALTAPGKEPSPTQRKKAERSAQRASSANQ